jgi:hypothetical protein
MVHRVGKEGSVLKDQDFLNKDVKIELGPLREEFVKQLKKDVKVSKKICPIIVIIIVVGTVGNYGLFTVNWNS